MNKVATLAGVVAAVMMVGLAALLTREAVSHGGKEWPVPEEAKKRVNPLKATPQALAAAKKIYDDTCVQCHGESGKGDGTEAMMYSVKPANFADKHMMDGMTDGEIFYKMTEGRRPMPGFKNTLTEEQRWQLVHFVRTFAQNAAKAPAKKGEPAKAHKH